MVMRFVGWLALGVSALVFGACGGGGGGGGSQGNCNPGPTATVTLTPSGLARSSVCVTPSGTLTFTNADTAVHDIEATDSAACPELNVGPIGPAQSKSVTVSANSQVCSFHVANSSAYDGTVAISSVITTGPGY
jgi:hypothetical protein